MKYINLSQGKVAIIDDDDFEYVSKFKWWYHRNGYAMRTIWYGRSHRPQHKHVALHRELLGVLDSRILVDHIDQNTLNNSRANLRLSTKSTNGCNRTKTIKNTSGFKGVTKHKKSKGWVSQIRVNGKNHYLGYFLSPEDAARAYDEAAIRYFGEYASINGI